MAFSISDGLLIVVTLGAPLLAVQAQKYLERGRDQKQRQIHIFRTLMIMRPNPLSPTNVEALNAVPIEFFGIRSITDSWKIYLDYLGKAKITSHEIWLPKRAELLVNLLYEMARYLNYNFDKVQIQNECYYPEGHFTIETEQTKIRQGLARILSGETSLPVKVESVDRSK